MHLDGAQVKVECVSALKAENELFVSLRGFYGSAVSRASRGRENSVKAKI